MNTPFFDRCHKRLAPVSILRIMQLSAAFCCICGNVLAAPPPDRQQEEIDRKTAFLATMVAKKSLKNPDSFKLDSAFVTKAGTACIEYSGTNAFNARMKNFAVVSRDKKTVRSSSDGSRGVQAWNKLCANTESTDYTELFIKTLAD